MINARAARRTRSLFCWMRTSTSRRLTYRVAGSTTLSFRPDIKRLDQHCQVGARRDVITVSETSEELASKAEPSLYFKKSKFPEFGEARRDYPWFQRELCMCVSPHYDQLSSQVCGDRLLSLCPLSLTSFMLVKRRQGFLKSFRQVSTHSC